MKVLIVGAGPIGCYVAQLLRSACASWEVAVIEEHEQIGKPVHCAGLVSPTVFSQSRLAISDSTILNRIHGAEFFYNGDNFQIHRQDVAVVIDRQKFDSLLGEGLNVHHNTRFVGLEKHGRGYLIETDKGEFYADIVIGADGANSCVRKAAGLRENMTYLRGVQFRIRCDDNRDSSRVQVYIKKPFFAWLIPEGNATVRSGIISDNPYHDLLGLLEQIQCHGEIIEKFAGVVAFGACDTQRENIALVGDAACQVKPLTQGGIYYGMRCAEVLVDCLQRNRLCDYEKEWKARFGKEIGIGIRLRRMFEELQEEDIARIFGVLKSNAAVIEQFGDFENHSKVLPMLLQNPELQIVLGKVIINFLKEIFI